MALVLFLILFFLGLIQFYLNSQKRIKVGLLGFYSHISRKTATLLSVYFSSDNEQMKHPPLI